MSCKFWANPQSDLMHAQAEINRAELFINRKILFKKDNRRRLNGSVFCNMSVGEKLTITFMNMTQVSYVGRRPQQRQ